MSGEKGKKGKIVLCGIPGAPQRPPQAGAVVAGVPMKWYLDEHTSLCVVWDDGDHGDQGFLSLQRAFARHGFPRILPGAAPDYRLVGLCTEEEAEWDLSRDKDEERDYANARYRAAVDEEDGNVRMWYAYVDPGACPDVSCSARGARRAVHVVYEKLPTRLVAESGGEAVRNLAVRLRPLIAGALARYPELACAFDRKCPLDQQRIVQLALMTAGRPHASMYSFSRYEKPGCFALLRRVLSAEDVATCWLLAMYLDGGSTSPRGLWWDYHSCDTMAMDLLGMAADAFASLRPTNHVGDNLVRGYDDVTGGDNVRLLHAALLYKYFNAGPHERLALGYNSGVSALEHLPPFVQAWTSAKMDYVVNAVLSDFVPHKSGRRGKVPWNVGAILHALHHMSKHATPRKESPLDDIARSVVASTRYRRYRRAHGSDAAMRVLMGRETAFEVTVPEATPVAGQPYDQQEFYSEPLALGACSLHMVVARARASVKTTSRGVAELTISVEHITSTDADELRTTWTLSEQIADLFVRDAATGATLLSVAHLGDESLALGAHLRLPAGAPAVGGYVVRGTYRLSRDDDDDDVLSEYDDDSSSDYSGEMDYSGEQDSST